MRIAAIYHVDFEDAGSIKKWAKDKEYEFKEYKLFNKLPKLPELDSFDLLVVMGGSMGANDDKLYPWLTPEKELIKKAILQGKGILGICLGAQLIASALGARVYPNKFKEIGWFPVDFKKAAITDGLFKGFPSKENINVFHWHGDTFDIPENGVHSSWSFRCKNQAFTYGHRVAGIQFHLEITDKGIAKLAENCRNDLADGKFIQKPNELKGRKSELKESGALLELLLANFENALDTSKK